MTLKMETYKRGNCMIDSLNVTFVNGIHAISGAALLFFYLL